MTLPLVPQSDPQSERMPSLLAEDTHWIVLNKPPHWLSIAGASSPPQPSGPKVLLSWAQEHWGRLWVVHRLDLETSGVILFARNEEFHRTANGWFARHEIKKEYDALASGVPSRPVYLVKEPVSGKPATSQIEVFEKWKSNFWAHISPKTGRRHQIRVHLASLGFPILGDAQYGGLRNETYTRVALHAVKLRLPTGQCFEAPWPEDMQQWMRNMR